MQICKSAKKGCQGGFVGRYYRVYIKGDLTNTPCRVKRKIPISKRSRTNPLRVGFTVASLPGEEDYYGFTLTGDGRYLLDDFTVTHNTVIGLWVMTHLKPKHLVVVPTRLLQEQWLERIETHTDLKPEEYAVMTYQAAITKAAKEQWTTKIIDEVHHLPANCYSEDTLVLTEDGWKSHFDWNGERIAIYDPKSDELRLEKPLKFVQMPYDGKMVRT